MFAKVFHLIGDGRRDGCGILGEQAPIINGDHRSLVVFVDLFYGFFFGSGFIVLR
jgi:hypothetical protein